MSDPLPSLDQALYGNAPSADVQKLGATPPPPQLKPEFRPAGVEAGAVPKNQSAPTPAPSSIPPVTQEAGVGNSPQAPSPPSPTTEAKPHSPTPSSGEGAFTMPDGLEADPALVGEFTAAAKELRIDKAGADRLVGLHAKALEAHTQAHNQARADWAETTRRDFGDQLPSVVRDIRGAIGSDADAQRFMELMNWSGLGSEPAVLRVLHRLARGQ